MFLIKVTILLFASKCCQRVHTLFELEMLSVSISEEGEKFVIGIFLKKGCTIVSMSATVMVVSSAPVLKASPQEFRLGPENPA